VDLEYENLLSEMKTIMGREKPLEEKLSHIFNNKSRIAAAAVAAYLAQQQQS